VHGEQILWQTTIKKARLAKTLPHLKTTKQLSKPTGVYYERFDNRCKYQL
jgi:hypothetical protein